MPKDKPDPPGGEVLRIGTLGRMEYLGLPGSGQNRHPQSCRMGTAIGYRQAKVYSRYEEILVSHDLKNSLAHL